MGNKSSLPLIVKSVACGTADLPTWAARNSSALQELLWTHGALLFRGFDVSTWQQFHLAFVAMAGDPIQYVEQSSPRVQVAREIYTSTEHPPEREIFLHNEQSYNANFPRFIAFFCHRPAVTGGETPIADSRRILSRIPAALRDRLHRSGYRYVRNFGSRLQMSWQQVFRASDASGLEHYCRQHDIEYEWLDERGGRRVRTIQKRQVIARHPLSNALTWFNHLSFFHFSSIDEDLRQLLLAVCGLDNLPHATYLGDGTVIADEDVAQLREAYRAEQVLFTWQAGDILLVDNMLVAHGRKAFTGARSVLVAMSSLCSWSAVKG